MSILKVLLESLYSCFMPTRYEYKVTTPILTFVYSAQLIASTESSAGGPIN